MDTSVFSRFFNFSLFFQWLMPLVVIFMPMEICQASTQKATGAKSFLGELQQQNQIRLSEIDKEIRALLMQTHNLDLTAKSVAQPLTHIEKQIDGLTLKRREFVLRQDFLDRLIFRIDRNYRGTDLKNFLVQTLLEMAKIETSQVQSDLGMVKFCNFLSLAIKEIPEPNENLMAFIEGYMKFSTILNPVSPNEFISQRNYTNGALYQKANPKDKTQVGEVVEQRLKVIEVQEKMRRKPFENRAPVLMPVEATLALPEAVTTTTPPGKESTEARLPKPEEQTKKDQEPLSLRIQLKQIHKTETKPGSLVEDSQKKEISPSEGYTN